MSYDLNELSAISPVDGRYWKDVYELAPYCSEGGLISTRVEIEVAYLIHLSRAGLIRKFTKTENNFLIDLMKGLTHTQAEKVKEIESKINHDVKAAELAFAEFVKGTSLAGLTGMIHFGLTSEDVNNLAYRIMLQRALTKVCLPELEKLITLIAERAESWKDIVIIGRTHGQPAIPTTLGKEVAIFGVRIKEQLRIINKIVLTGKLNGAIGNYSSFKFAFPETDWVKFSRKFVGQWGLKLNRFTNQINPFDDIVEILQAINRINSIIIGFDQDMWRYISDFWLGQEKVEGEIGSSVMTQKINPINFENGAGNCRVSNYTLIGLAQDLPVSRLQRDLENSTESRNIGSALAFHLLAVKKTIKGFTGVYLNHDQIFEDLDENWSILGEPVQTMLRKIGCKDAYDIVQKYTKGEKLDQTAYLSMIDNLPVDDTTKERLNNLTPHNYIGLAPLLTELAIKEMLKN